MAIYSEIVEFFRLIFGICLLSAEAIAASKTNQEKCCDFCKFNTCSPILASFNPFFSNFRVIFSCIGSIFGSKVFFVSTEVGTNATVFISNENKEGLLQLMQQELSKQNVTHGNVTSLDIEDVERGGAVHRIPSEVFTMFPNLHSFGVYLDITEIVIDDFVKATGLKSLSIVDSRKLNKLSAGIFPLPKLSELRLLLNEIEIIDDFTFANLSSLKEIDLSKNKLTKINRNTFTGLVALEKLDLSVNMIGAVENYAFTDLKALTDLNLSRNNLKVLGDHMFDGLNNLLGLIIRSNQIESIGDSLQPLTSIAILSLDENSIKDVDWIKLTKLPNLLLLELSNQKTGLNLEGHDITSALLSKSKLMNIHLAHNNITNVSSLEVLRVFPNLNFVNLRGNQKLGKQNVIEEQLNHIFNKSIGVSV